MSQNSPSSTDPERPDVTPDVTPDPSGAVVACLAAGLVLTGVEVLRWLGLRNYLPSGYYLLCVGLALGVSLLIGVIGGVRKLSRVHSLALWAAVAAGLVNGLLYGLVLGIVLSLVLSFKSRPKLKSGPVGGAVEGAAVGAGMGLVLLKGKGLSDFLAGVVPGATAEILSPVAGALLLLATLAWGPQLIARVAGPLRVVGYAALPILISLWFGVEPWTHQGSGSHRRPRQNFAAQRPASEEAKSRPDVILIVLDTLRADHLSVYGYERETTPELARLMQERENAVAFPSAYSNGTWTVPSHGSLFTGLMPNKHGAHFDLDGSLRVQFGLHKDTPRLAGQLQSQGYATLGVFANHWLKIVGGLSEGFDTFFQVIRFSPLPFLGEAVRNQFLPGAYMEAAKGGPRASMVNRSLLDLVDNWDGVVENPLFLFANYGDVHGPYAPPKPFLGTFHPVRLGERARHVGLALPPEQIEILAARYDEELLYLDHQLGFLFDSLDASGFLDGAWVFITSDHGEAFGKHGFTEHGTSVHQEVVRVPLIVFPPKGVDLPVVDAPVSLLDVSATIAAIAGTSLPNSPGRDLRSLDAGQAMAVIEFYGDARKADIHGAIAGVPQRSVLRGKWKLVARTQGESEEIELFDISNDPDQEHDLAPENPDVVAELTGHLEPFGEPARSTVRLDPRSLSDLNDLGYLGQSDSEAEAVDQEEGEREP
ncbi:MAG: arylsulfatase A-like enzyme [Planctomycetota bacterium]|jgi:arylsulfatase A-like enzyme